MFYAILNMFSFSLDTNSVRDKISKFLGEAMSFKDFMSIFSELREANKRLQVLYNIYQATTKEKNIHRLIRQAADILKHSYEFDAFVFYIFDDYLNKSVLYYALGLPVQIIRQIEILPLYAGLTGNYLSSSENFQYIKYVDLDHSDNPIIPLFVAHDFTDEIAFPILFEDKPIGGISLINKHNKAFPPKDQESLKVVCGILSTVIEKAKLFHSLSKELEEHKRTSEKLKIVNAELERSASTDQLTNLWNRRYFISKAEQELDRSRRNKYPLSLLLLDIDHFKKVNDIYGHQTGDQVLIEFATLLRENIRSFDSLARWGGEEFLILAPHLRANNAILYADRLCQLIAQYTFQEAGEITTSIGVAELTSSDTLDSLIKKVDNALYRAKENGRNRVESSSLFVIMGDKGT